MMNDVRTLTRIRDNARMAHERGEPHLMLKGQTVCEIARGLIRREELELVDDPANSKHQILVRWKGENQKE
jgi:hypothetical protein